MSETLQYIDTYFNGELSSPEKAAFESRCESDPVFAEDVAFYISARAQLKDDLYNQKKKEFHELYVQLTSAEKGAIKKGLLRKILPYAAAVAACFLIFLGWQLFIKGPSLESQVPKQLADEYISEKLENLGVSMGVDKDSLELGIDAINKKNYNEAEAIFRVLSTRDKTKAQAVENLGVIYLLTGKYDQAINQFDSLAKLPNLYANPGLFYKAIVLMERSAKGDREMAKQVLEQVISQKLPDSEKAKIWIQKL